eukprot:1161059-Pelagomonas_calceolata.AAC.7
MSWPLLLTSWDSPALRKSLHKAILQHNMCTCRVSGKWMKQSTHILCVQRISGAVHGRPALHRVL